MRFRVAALKVRFGPVALFTVDSQLGGLPLPRGPERAIFSSTAIA